MVCSKNMVYWYHIGKAQPVVSSPREITRIARIGHGRKEETLEFHGLGNSAVSTHRAEQFQLCL